MQGGTASTATLSERERALLDFERGWWREDLGTNKAAAIEDALGISSSRYYALLLGLIGRQEAFRYDPLLIARLRRRRSQRLEAAMLGRTPRSRRS